MKAKELKAEVKKIKGKLYGTLCIQDYATVIEKSSFIKMLDEFSDDEETNLTIIEWETGQKCVDIDY
ncbi:hypothetical protein [uncultured Arcobacter sp.]|uniref:hypothetical protein n=1 Tax=uncultured Arcobacter sp. TaxID=165434 RepID=UPI002627DA31|nr:hypothetical protein [uncultured Arcobacter sp.]